MSTLKIKPNPVATEVFFTMDKLCVTLADGCEVSIPLACFPRLCDADEKLLNDWRLIGKGIGVQWESLDEDITIETLLCLR